MARMLRENGLGLAKFCMMAADEAMGLLLPLLLYKLHQNVAESGSLYFLSFGGRCLGYPLAGVLSDRYRAERVFVFGNGVRALLGALVVGLLCWAPESLMWAGLSVLAFSQGVLGGIANLAFEATMPKLFEREAWPLAQAKIQGADQMGYLCGPLLGGGLSSLELGLSGVLILAACYLGAAGIAGGWLRATVRTRIVPRASLGFWRDLRSGLAVIAGSSTLMLLVLLTWLDNFLLGLHLAAQVPLSLGLFHQSEARLSALLTLSGILSVALAALLAPLQRRLSGWGLWRLSYLFNYAGFLFVGLAKDFRAYAIGLVLVELACAASIYALRLLRAEIIPDPQLGRALGMVFFLQQISLPLGAGLVSLSANLEHLQTLIFKISLSLGVLTLILVPLALSKRKPLEALEL